METFLEVRNIHKRFGGVHALKGVDLSVGKGEGHCLVGENGSGKSTLIKIMAGVLQPDSGEIWIEGERVSHIDSNSTTSRGIHVIYQDLSLFPNLTVAENIALSELKAESRSLINWRRVEQIARAAMDRIKVDIDPGERVGDLPVGLQQVVAICRALTRNLKLLILDEPTASLTKREIDHLLSIVRDLQARGIAILFVSHKLNEVIAVADRVTVLRDGSTVGVLPKHEITDEKLIALMTGRELKASRFEFAGERRRKLLEVRHLSKRHNFRDISFELYAGEIVGIAGLIGSGRTELAQALFGVSPAESGEILVDGRAVRIRSVQDAVQAGIAYVPENRLTQGLFLKQPVGDNAVAAILERLLAGLRLIDMGRRRQTAERWIHALGVKAAGADIAAQTLSGGNQQRLVIAKWLASNPKILILDGPTTGIDVMAKGAIHQLIRESAAQGMGVLLISDEVAELVTNANRILVMQAGRIRAEVATRGVQPEAVQKLVEEGGGRGLGQPETVGVAS